MLLQWLINHRIKRLKIQRAGVIGVIKGRDESGYVSPMAYKLLGEIDEKIRQLEEIKR